MKLRLPVGFGLVFALLHALLTGCSGYTGLLSQPVRVGSDWVVIRLNPPISPRWDLEGLTIDIAEGVQVDSGDLGGRQQIVSLSNGKRAHIYAELVSTDRAIIPLEQGGHACPGGSQGRCVVSFIGRLPERSTFVAFRLQSSEPVTVRSALWTRLIDR